MDFFTNAIDVLQTLVIALGGGLCVWGGINLLEGYGQDNPASNAYVRQSNAQEFDRQQLSLFRRNREERIENIILMCYN